MGLVIGFPFGLLRSEVFSLGLKIRSLGMVVCRSVGLGVCIVESFCFNLVFGFSSKRWFIELAFSGFVFLGFVVCGTDVCVDVDMDILGWPVKWWVW